MGEIAKVALSSHYLYDLQETKRFLPSNARSEGDRKGRIYNKHTRTLGSIRVLE